MTNDLSGFRQAPGGGARLRADIVDVYIVRRVPGMLRAEHQLQVLQLLRADDPLRGTWQPVMGHAEPGEAADAAARRELHEEVGLRPSDPALLGLWALEQVHPFYVSAVDAVVLSPRFVALVSPGWQPRVELEHSAARWVSLADASAWFMWPGQIAACAEIARLFHADAQSIRAALRLA